MIYTEFGNTGAMVSKLGFGGMRLPMVEINGKSVVNDDLAIPLIRRAFDLGVNYIDSAPGYCGRQSEAAIGRAVKGYRDKVYISTKNGLDDESTGDDLRSGLERSLKNLDVDYIDFYHFWGIRLKNYLVWESKENSPIDAIRKAKEEGLIKHVSFSTHDKAENICQIIDTGLMESVTCQYNLLDRSNEPALAHAHAKGLGTVVMGPVGGGKLGAPNEVIQGLLANKVKSSAEMALRFVLANPNVNIALSGMQTIEIVEENAAIASMEGQLTEEEHAHVEEMLQENKRLAELYCTGCNYCMPCPQGINIPHLFSIMNNHRVYALTDFARRQYSEVMSGQGWIKSADATKCVECGACEAKCPQKLSIISQLKETHKAMTE